MDEGNVRPYAGQQGDGTVHRVGLTRHCIASGLVQLPFALRDTFPEGELLALDVERDEAVVLEVVPPRGLAGLAEFFEAHDLQVNDSLEIRVRGHDVGEVRLAAVRSARRPRRSEDRPIREDVASPDARPVPPPLPDTSVQDALDRDGWSSVRVPAQGPDVVETIGSVTVRRLGAGRFAAPATTTLVQPADDLEAEAPSERDARLGVHGRTEDDASASASAGADATFETRARLEPGARLGAHDPPIADPFEASSTESAAPTGDEPRRRDAAVPPEPSASSRPSRPSEPSEPSEPPEPSASSEPSDGWAEASTPSPEDAEIDALLVVDDARSPSSSQGSTAAGPPAEAPSVDGAARQPSLFDPRNAGRPPFAAPTRPRAAPDRAPSRPAERRPAERRRVESRRGESRPAASRPTASPSADSRPAPSPRTDHRSASSPPSVSPPAARARPAAVQLDVNDLADPEVDAAVRQRAREEELSRAGDLRSRIVRWLLAPSTPVIVPIERVQHAFDLPVDVAREVVEGVLEEPPPSLRLTRLREDLLRVSRVTVEQED